MTYPELAWRVQDQYVAWGGRFPRGRSTHPWVAGNNRHGFILGDQRMAELADILVMPDGQGAWMVNAGTMRGLHPGDILAVHPPASRDRGQHSRGAPLTHVRVTKVMDDTARVQPCAYGELPGNRPPVAGRCERAFIDLGERRLKIAVAERASNGRPIPEAKINALVHDVEKVVRAAGPLVAFTRDAKEADWLVNATTEASDEFFLTRAAPAEGRENHRGLDMTPLFDAFGPYPAKALLQEVPQLLRRLARTQNLLSLAAGISNEQERDGIGLDVEAKLILFKSTEDQEGKVAEQTDRAKLLPGMEFACQLHNSSQRPVDVSLLYIDDKYRMTSLSPLSGGVYHLSPGESVRTPRRKVGGDREDKEQPGQAQMMHLVVIAVEARGTPVDFSFLANPDLKTALAAAREGASRERTTDSPFGRLMIGALYGEGDVHGLDVGVIKQITVNKLSWRYPD